MPPFLSMPPHTLRSPPLCRNPLPCPQRITSSCASGSGSTRRLGGAFLSGRDKFYSIGFDSSRVLRYGLYGNLFPEKERKERMPRFVCASAVLSPHNLQWISAVATIVLMVSKGTAIPKSFLPPLFALQAPLEIVTWINGEYGAWTAFLVLLVRLFYFIPGELDIPFVAMLLVMVAPYQAMTLRGATSGAIVSCAISAYLAYQHFSKAGSLQRAFDQGAIIATLAIICILAISFSLLL